LINSIVVTHLNPDIVLTLAAVVKVINLPKRTPLTLVMSNPAKTVLTAKLGDTGCEILNDPNKVTIFVPSKAEEIQIGRRTLQCIAATTPRYPELLCLYERTTRRLFSSCFFSAHVNPQKGVLGQSHPPATTHTRT
jgi:flavorubredoxin